MAGLKQFDNKITYKTMIKISIYKKLLLLAFPLFLEHLLTFSLIIIDSLLVGSLGINDIVGVGISNEVLFIYFMLLLALTDGMSILLAQFFGKKDMIMVRKVFALTLIIAFLFTVVFCIFTWIYTKEIISIFSKDQEVIKIGNIFLRTLLLSYPLWVVSWVIMLSLNSMGKTFIPLIITIIAIIINIPLSIFLIYGHFGLPVLGSYGIAIASLVAKIIEFLCFIVVFFMLDGLKAKITEYFGWSRDFLKKALSIGIPVFFNNSIWAIGVFLISIAYSKLGIEVLAALRIVDLLLYIMSVVFMALATGTNIIIAQNIGAGKINRVFIIAKEILKLSVILGLVVVVLSFVIIESLLSFYNLTDQVKLIAKNLLLITSIFSLFQLFNWVMVIGVLRAGGDTKFSLFLDTIFLFLYAVPIAFLGAMVWDLDIYTLFILVSIEEFFKLGLGLHRFASKKWVNNLTI